MEPLEAYRSSYCSMELIVTESYEKVVKLYCNIGLLGYLIGLLIMWSLESFSGFIIVILGAVLVTIHHILGLKRVAKYLIKKSTDKKMNLQYNDFWYNDNPNIFYASQGFIDEHDKI